MAGILGDIGSMLVGGAPGPSFDPATYLARMKQLNDQIDSLYSSAPQSDILASPAFADIRTMLGPSAGGGLSMPLMAQYNAGALRNKLNAQAGSADVLSAMQGRNLAGSSIAQQGLENASMQETLANSGLLASLYGIQNQDTSQLASMLGQGGMFDISQNNALLNAHANALAGISGQYGSLAGMGLQQQYGSNLATYQNQNAMGMDLLKMGLFAAMMPAAPAAAGGSAATSGVVGSGATAPAYLPGMATMGPGTYGALPPMQ